MSKVISIKGYAPSPINESMINQINNIITNTIINKINIAKLYKITKNRQLSTQLTQYKNDSY